MLDAYDNFNSTRATSCNHLSEIEGEAVVENATQDCIHVIRSTALAWFTLQFTIVRYAVYVNNLEQHLSPEDFKVSSAAYIYVLLCT